MLNKIEAETRFPVTPAIRDSCKPGRKQKREEEEETLTEQGWRKAPRSLHHLTSYPCSTGFTLCSGLGKDSR